MTNEKVTKHLENVVREVSQSMLATVQAALDTGTYGYNTRGVSIDFDEKDALVYNSFLRERIKTLLFPELTELLDAEFYIHAPTPQYATGVTWVVLKIILATKDKED